MSEGHLDFHLKCSRHLHAACVLDTRASCGLLRQAPTPAVATLHRYGVRGSITTVLVDP
ncbi:MAG: hypothetical protein WBJ51_07860 [Methanoculleus sp.]